MRVFLLSLLLAAAVVSGFQPVTSRSGRPTSSARQGIFDKFVNQMEAGYKGEDSAFQKQKAADEQKRLNQRKRADERKSRGYTELEEVQKQGKKTFAKLKVDEEEEPPAKDEKKFFGLF
jgi:hypothetical protein